MRGHLSHGYMEVASPAAFKFPPSAGTCWSVSKPVWPSVSTCLPPPSRGSALRIVNKQFVNKQLTFNGIYDWKIVTPIIRVNIQLSAWIFMEYHLGRLTVIFHLGRLRFQFVPSPLGRKSAFYAPLWTLKSIHYFRFYRLSKMWPNL